MGFWIFMFIMDLLIPFTMIGFGKKFLKQSPKEINSLYGYRTTMSMKNKDTWDFAHKYCGKLWYYGGLILLPFTIIGMCFLLGKDDDTVGTMGSIISILQIIPLVGSIIPTELALRKTFDNHGHRK